MKVICIIWLITLATFVSSQELSIDENQLLAGKGETKVITIGQGIDKNAALSNAFENAIMEAIGTMVASKTIIENDALIKDEILVYSKGFIKQYKILSEVSEKELHSITIAAIVTEQQVFKSLEAKGISVSYNTQGMFAQIDEWSDLQVKEEKMVRNIFSDNMAFTNMNLFDYSIEIGDPVKQKTNSHDYSTNNNGFIVPIKVFAQPNQNYSNFRKNMISVLNELAYDKNEFIIFGDKLPEKYAETTKQKEPKENKRSKRFSINSRSQPAYQPLAHKGPTDHLPKYQLTPDLSRSYEYQKLVVNKEGEKDLKSKYLFIIPNYSSVETYRRIYDGPASFDDEMINCVFVNPEQEDFNELVRELSSVELVRAREAGFGNKYIDLFNKDYSPYLFIITDGPEELPGKYEFFKFADEQSVNHIASFVKHQFQNIQFQLQVVFLDGTMKTFSGTVPTNMSISDYDISFILDYNLEGGRRHHLGGYRGNLFFMESQTQRISFNKQLKFSEQELRNIKELKIIPKK